MAKGMPAACNVNMVSRPSSAQRRAASAKAAACAGAIRRAVPALPFHPEASRASRSSTARGSPARSTTTTSSPRASARRRLRRAASDTRRRPMEAGHSWAWSWWRTNKGRCQCSETSTLRWRAMAASRQSPATGPRSFQRSTTTSDGARPPRPWRPPDDKAAIRAPTAGPAPSGSTKGVPSTGRRGTGAGSSRVVRITTGTRCQPCWRRRGTAAKKRSPSETTATKRSTKDGSCRAAASRAWGSAAGLGSRARCARAAQRRRSGSVNLARGRRRTSMTS